MKDATLKCEIVGIETPYFWKPTNLTFMLEFLCVDLHNKFNNVINQCYLFLHCGP